MSKATSGRPLKPEHLRKSKNKITYYISDDSLSRLCLEREDLSAYLDTIIEGQIRDMELMAEELKLEADDGR